MIIECPSCGATQDHFWWDGLYHPDEPCVGPPNPPETVACAECGLPIPNPHAEAYPKLPEEDSIQDRIRYHNHPDRPPYDKKKYPSNRFLVDVERKPIDCDLCENTGWIADGFMLDEHGEVLVEQYTGPCPDCAVIPTGYYNE